MASTTIWMKTFISALFSFALCWAASEGNRVEYVGGTLATFDKTAEGRVVTSNDNHLRFQASKKTVEVPYEKITVLEYGQKVDRRYLSAVFLSPLFLLAKSRKHFLTIGFEDAQGKQQAMVFRVQKNDVRTLLVSLEARTGRKVAFQDEEARKAGKG